MHTMDAIKIKNQRTFRRSKKNKFQLRQNFLGLSAEPILWTECNLILYIKNEC